MERNRRAGGASGSGAVFSARRQRGRNQSDEEDKTDEIRDVRFRKRPKKDMYGLSAPANSLNKRKCWGVAQDTQPFGSLEELKAEDDDERSAPPQVQKLVKSRVQLKEDKFFMDFSAVPRKQRSSISLSSRLTSTAKEHQDLCFTQQQSPATTLNGSSLSRKKRLKPSGTELLTTNVSQAYGFSAVSDQEAEVAEALFVLASSTPPHAGVIVSKLEAKLDTEAKSASFVAPHQRFVVVPPSSGPDFATAGSPSELVHSSVGETEMEFALPRRHSLAGEATSFRSETSISKISAGSPHCVPCWPRHSKETNPRVLEEKCKDSNGTRNVKQESHINAEMEEKQPEVVKIMPIATQMNNVDSLGNHNEALTKSSRSDGVHNCESKIDLKAPLTNCKVEGENGREHSSPFLVKEDSGKGLNAGNGYLKLTGRADGGTQGSNQVTDDQKEKITSETVRTLRDRDVKGEDHSSKPSPNRKVKDTGNSSVSSCFSSLSSTAVSRHAPMGSAGWMNGFPHLGYGGPAATSWAASSSLSIDMKAAQPAVQLPYAAVSSPVPKMKSCATHVYVAHYIHREQLATRHSLWSAALCKATAYNLNIPPLKPLDNERSKEAFACFTQKARTHQTESSFAYNISQSSMQRMSSCGTAPGSSVAGSNLPTSSRASSETSMVTASGHAVADHAQYLQTMMRQSGAAQFFNGPFFQPHLIPHLKPSTHQAANVLPVQRQQQGKGASSSPIEQQKVLQSSFQSQRQSQNLKETSASESSANLEREHKEEGTSANSRKFLHPCYPGSSNISVLKTLSLAQGTK